ncbi:tRNA pseudouridine(38-40) synthase TruA [Desulfoplanes formicivorans]|uniref:tRNA pseudouridine synthase A n=1 Tax=Desulfoplanes formicivorans TaxID=1592317 RepID=A0A194AH64_9BACT|nr:tRNA pseudouridine(38-40) synthase TruA [Desulfoplanes formicivorans]GAU08555.1 tRNA pseudouridine synthase A [Desulfoplanes formicivorans]
MGSKQKRHHELCALPPEYCALKRIRLTIAYEGTDFCGWQIQKGQPSIQECLETHLSVLCGRPTRIFGSGRTDSGVHALGQVAHVDILADRTHIPWHKALNAMLPRSVRILEVANVGFDFHARYSCLSKTYSYTMWTNPDYVLPQRRRYVWDTGPLDFQAMDRAAAYLVGQHDFKSFQNLGTDVQSTIRTITRIERSSGITDHEQVWTFSANGFLKQMVRNMVGLLYQVGRGKLSPEQAKEILEARDRSLAPATAPAKGLCLEYVEYPQDKK